MGGQAEKGLRVCPKRRPVPALIQSTTRPSNFSSHSPTPSTHGYHQPRPHLLLQHGQPPPLPRSSCRAAGGGGVGGAQNGDLLQSQFAHITPCIKPSMAPHYPHHESLHQAPPQHHSHPLPTPHLLLHPRLLKWDNACKSFWDLIKVHVPNLYACVVLETVHFQAPRWC